MISRIKAWFFRRKILDIQEFAQRHRRYLVMVFDPKDDTMFASYGGKQVSGRIASADGINHKVIKNVLKHSTFEREIDRLLGGVIDLLQTPLKIGNSLYSFIDGALYQISKALKKTK